MNARLTLPESTPSALVQGVMLVLAMIKRGFTALSAFLECHPRAATQRVEMRTELRVLCSLTLLVTALPTADGQDIVRIAEDVGGNDGLAISDSGRVVGILGDSIFLGGISIGREVFLWTPDIPNGSAGSATLLPFLSISFTMHMNDAGQILFDTGSFWDPLDGILSLPPSGTLEVRVNVLNNLGQVVLRDGTIWDKVNGAQAITGLIGPIFTGNVSAGAINDYGQIVGRADTVSGDAGFLWTPDVPNGLSGTAIELPMGRPSEINGLGQVVGPLVAVPGSVPGFRVAIWTPTVANGTTMGTLAVFDIELFNLGLNNCDSLRLDDSGRVLINLRGFAGNLDDGARLWVPDSFGSETGALLKLPSLSANRRTVSADINSSGQVTGFGPAFLWSPAVANPGGGTLTGDNENNLLEGGAGPDQLNGGGGDDILRGGDSDDVLTGGSGADSLSGGDGNDILDGGANNDRLIGGPGDDIIDGGPGCDVLFGGEGDDVLDCGPSDSQGNDTIDGGPGNDTIFGGQGNDILIGGLGDDSIDGRSGNDDIEGGLGLDDVLAGPGNDTVRVMAGDVPAGQVEFIDGGTGSDTLVLTGFTAGDVTGADSVFVVTDPVTGGTYEITDVETLVFQ